jgi:predicted RND superfamily exporter protein
MRDPGVVEFNALRDEIEAEASQHFGPEARLLGPTVVSYAAIARVLTDMRSSVALLLLTILGASVVAFGVRRELFAMVLVNVLPLLLGAALLALLGWSLDLGVVVIFAIALGLIVDDTIHLMVRYREQLDDGDRPHAAMAEAVRTTGLAVVVTSVCLAIGFGVQAMSSLPQLIRIGTLGSFVVVVAMLADLWLLPALVSWLHSPARIQHRNVLEHRKGSRERRLPDVAATRETADVHALVELGDHTVDGDPALARVRPQLRPRAVADDRQA